VFVSGTLAIQLDNPQNAQYSLHKRNTSEFEYAGQIAKCFCNAGCQSIKVAFFALDFFAISVAFFARNIVNFFCNCACMFFCPKLREFCRMAICAGAGFSRTVVHKYP